MPGDRLDEDGSKGLYALTQFGYRNPFVASIEHRLWLTSPRNPANRTDYGKPVEQANGHHE